MLVQREMPHKSLSLTRASPSAAVMGNSGWLQWLQSSYPSLDTGCVSEYSREGFDHCLFSRLIQMKWLHRIATRESSFLSFVFPLSLIPSRLKTFMDGFDTKPLAPTSMVLHKALNPLALARSTSVKYFVVFFIFQYGMFSSAGDVSSKNRTIFFSRL